MKKKKVEVNKEQSKELREPVWAVISFDRCVARDLTYPEAETQLKDLAAQKVSGLCIVSNAAAARMTGS